MRFARRRLLVAPPTAPLVLPAGAPANGGPGDDQPFGYGKFPLESRFFSSCKRFEAAIPFSRSCLADAAYALVVKTNDPANELPKIDTYVHTQAGWLQGNCHVLMHTVGR